MSDGWTRAEVETLTSAVMWDVRSPEEFARGTVPGATNVPVDTLDAEMARLPADAIVVTVCTHGGGRSQGAARRLREAGFARARHLVGGVEGGTPG